MRHTPGPWTAKGAVILCSRGQVIASCEPTTVPMEQRRVNACLLAAAPELLTACKNALSVLEEFGMSELDCEPLRAVIKKAEDWGK